MGKTAVVVGAGFTGLAAAHRLLSLGWSVTIVEKGAEVSGLASSFQPKHWKWALEKYYHHWFTNDVAALNLAKKVQQKIMTIKPRTDIYYQRKIYPFDSPQSILRFSHFSLLDKIRVGATLLYLKLSENNEVFESTRSLPWIKQWMGATATKIVWEPLFRGKFGPDKDNILLTWFWARIKKRTPKLAYPVGGFACFAEKLVQRIKQMRGTIHEDTEIRKITRFKNSWVVSTNKLEISADAILVTTPSKVFTNLFPGLPAKYRQNIQTVRHLHAQVLVLILNKSLMRGTYWLNMTDNDSPFLAVVEHTNFMAKKNYGGEHVVYISNYLPANHPFLFLNKQQLLKKFDPYLAQINQNYASNLIETYLFSVPGAQPIVDEGYKMRIPQMHTPLQNVYVANMDMVYPWDRGTNYAIEYGERVAELMTRDFSDR